jgi:hypothetical protein
MAITTINPQNKSLLPRRRQEKRARTGREIISKRMSSVVGGLCCPACWWENPDVMDSFAITVATKWMRRSSLPIQAFLRIPAPVMMVHKNKLAMAPADAAGGQPFERPTWVTDPLIFARVRVELTSRSKSLARTDVECGPFHHNFVEFHRDRNPCIQLLFLASN